MKNWLKILSFFIENKEMKITINSLSKKLNLNYRIAFQETKALEKEGLVKIEKVGNSNICRFNYKLSKKVFEAEETRKNNLLKNKSLDVIYGEIEEIKDPFFIFLVFGSYASGKQTKHSDIDFCIISNNVETKRKAVSIVDNVPVRTHILEFSTRKFLEMLATNKDNVGKEILKNNIILKGIESFYEIVNYAY